MLNVIPEFPESMPLISMEIERPPSPLDVRGYIPRLAVPEIMVPVPDVEELRALIVMFLVPTTGNPIVGKVSCWDSEIETDVSAQARLARHMSEKIHTKVGKKHRIVCF